ncbi:MAG TPA: type II toxin-antitoxin system HipA family toxin [Pantanalinema sp.]
MLSRCLSVRLNGIPQAILEQDEHGKLRLTYLPEATRALSLNLPLREAPYESDACEAFFGGLLPESEQARKAIARRYGINANNSFSLLRAIGYDCAGAVSLHAPDEPIRSAESFLLDGRVLSQAELARHIRELPEKPLFTGIDGLRLSLAGTQDKAAVCIIDGEVALPHHGTPTTHILKPAVSASVDSVRNEFICMKLAALIGLEAPSVEIRSAEEIPYLLIARYDRTFLPNGHIARIHQEDFCQALGRSSLRKYQAEGGPGLKDCFALMQRTSQPALSITRLLRHLIFNVLIGNWDAHAKNYSLLHQPNGRIALAPVYDVLCTRIYPDFIDRMAMKIGGYYEVDQLIERRWRSFCDEVGIGFNLLSKTLMDTHAALQQAIQHGFPDLDDPRSRQILAFIGRHATDVLRRFHPPAA